MKRNHNPKDTEIAKGFTVRDYEEACKCHPPDRDAIAEAIRRRFTERYIEPAQAKSRHGFTMMAVSCLMIEALESFRQGWENSKDKSRAAFCFFIDISKPFAEFRGHAQLFYDHIRCGILHQAETTGGWRIRRDASPLFDTAALTINAELFLKALVEVLSGFCDGLKTADWDGQEWKRVRKKMNAIVRECRPAQ